MRRFDQSVALIAALLAGLLRSAGRRIARPGVLGHCSYDHRLTTGQNESAIGQAACRCWSSDRWAKQRLATAAKRMIWVHPFGSCVVRWACRLALDCQHQSV